MSNDCTKSLESLLTDVRGCTLCAGLPLGPKPLLQVSSSARILIAGQAPGRRTHESAIPFDDVSGDRLRSWLGIDRDAFYDASRIAILPMGFCYPGTGNSGDLPPRKECAPAWRERLLLHMQDLQLTVLIGMHAQRWHLSDAGGKTLTENVENWEAFWPDAIPLPHPSPRNTMWLKKNPCVEAMLLPKLRRRVKKLIG
ncbi:MAG TPA: uracil-DNA glycosylase family protein [Woeseiaceae bacterium]|nr:uracil-DNA glycosylase family protein [Woeseiaceae bacterium]